MNRISTFDDLERIHAIAAERFPHEYLDVGLGAIGLFLHTPPKNAGYTQTPSNSVTFASIGVDGIHFGSLTNSETFDPTAPVVLTIPMSFDAPNFIVGSDLHDFLRLGCQHGYDYLANLHLDRDSTLSHFATQPRDFHDDRASGILSLLQDELALKPWHNVHERFAELQDEHLNRITLPRPDHGGRYV